MDGSAIEFEACADTLITSSFVPACVLTISGFADVPVSVLSTSSAVTAASAFAQPVTTPIDKLLLAVLVVTIIS